MLSIVTGNDGSRMDMRGNTNTNKGVSIEEPTSPASSKPSGAYSGGGRRLVAKPEGGATGNSIPGSNRPVRKTRGPKTMEELDRRVEEDQIELQNVKRDIAKQQKMEIMNSQKSLMGLKKEYDAIHAENNVAEKHLKSVQDKVNGFKSIYGAMQEQQEKVKEQVKDLAVRLATQEDLCAAEQRTLDMQKLMFNRLEGDTSALKLENTDLTFHVEKMRYDMASVDSTYQMSKVELSDKEQQLNQLISQRKQRKRDRLKKMSMLQELVDNGESSLSMIQKSVFEESIKRSPRAGADQHHEAFPMDQHDRTNRTSILGGVSDRARTPTRVPSRQRTLSSRPRTTSAGGLDDDDDFDFDFDEPTDSPRKQAKRMNMQQVEELIERYKGRGVRMEKLTQLERDLNDNIGAQKDRRKELEQRLQSTKQEIEQLASSRQVYQEVDNKATALAAIRKQSESYKEKEYRLRVNLDALKRAVPRLLSKMTKIQHPVPNDNQLSDSLLKLNAELNKFFKDIQTAMAKEATSDELSAMAAAGNEEDGSDGKSHLDKLISLPGFSKIQKQLFFNMMGARPDMSNKNVRIPSKAQKKKNELSAPSGSKELSLKTVGGIQHGHSHGHHKYSISSPVPVTAPLGSHPSAVTSVVRRALDDGADRGTDRENGHGLNAPGSPDKIHSNRDTITTQKDAEVGEKSDGNGKKTADVALTPIGNKQPKTQSMLQESPVIDRDTAKAISALVLETIGKGVIPEEVLNKGKKKPVKMEYKFRG